MAVLWIAVGAAVGVLGAVAAQAGPWWLPSVVHYASPYVLIVGLVGATAPRVRVAAVRSAGCFVAFVVAYYVEVAIRFGGVPVLYAAAWLAAAVTVCPIGAAAIRWAIHREGLAASMVFAATGATALADGSVGNIVRVAFGRLDASALPSVTGVTACIGLVVAAVVVLVIPRRTWTRITASALLLPCAALSTLLGWSLHFGLGPYL